MAKSLKSFATILLILLIVNSLFFMAKGRPLIAANHYKSQSSIGEAVENIFEGFNIGAIKTGGPSPGGKGHEFTNSHALGDAKNSGPSPGEGHDFTNSRTLAEVNSGPSSGGKGHDFTDSQTLAKVNSGPSGGGKGHDLTNSQTPAHVNSGPSRGEEGHDFTNAGTDRSVVGETKAMVQALDKDTSSLLHASQTIGLLKICLVLLLIYQ